MNFSDLLILSNLQNSCLCLCTQILVQSTRICIYNCSCAEWNAICFKIKRRITRSHAARPSKVGVQFVTTSLISEQYCTTRSAISTLLHSF